MAKLELGIDFFSIEDFFELMLQSDISLSEKAKSKIIISFNNVQNIVNSSKTVYGINTGFGPLCDTKINKEETSLLQHNLLISHAVGVGNPISKNLSKIMLLAKAHSLAKGFSGISLEVIERILFFINNDLIPVVPSQGSVGASGDLAPLAHLFLPIIGEGYFWHKDASIPASEMLKINKLKPLTLGAKEGLALINGTQFILAHSLQSLQKFNYLLNLADYIGAMSCEAFHASYKPFLESLHQLRPYIGNQQVAAKLYSLLHQSENANSHRDCERVQDPYSIRCMPQVHGASRNAFKHLQELTEIELNSVTDNPIILDENTAISGGNFHGQPLAMALDYCCIAASEIGNISDRRCYLLLEGQYDLPKLLIEKSGLNSGFMIPQYTTAALCTENKTLCFPASADSIPTSMGQEDHVSMGSISGRKLMFIIENVHKILAIELLYACQGMEFRRPKKMCLELENIHSLVRKYISKLENDRLIGNDIQEAIKLIDSKEFKKLIEVFI